MVIFPSPAGGSIKPAAAGVQALTMNSPGSAWTPVLAGLRQLICRRRKNTKSKPTSYTLYRTGTKYRSGHFNQDFTAKIVNDFRLLMSVELPIDHGASRPGRSVGSDKYDLMAKVSGDD